MILVLPVSDIDYEKNIDDGDCNRRAGDMMCFNSLIFLCIEYLNQTVMGDPMDGGTKGSETNHIS